MTAPRAPLAVEPVALDKAGGQVRLSVERFKGRDLFNCRYWYAAPGGKLRPSPHGVALPLSRWPEFVDAVRVFDERLSAARQEAAPAEP